MLKPQLEQALVNREATEAALRMTIDAISGTNSAMATLGVGLISIASFGFLWYRRVKLDRREDLSSQRGIDEALKAAEMWRVLCEDQTRRATEAENQIVEERARADAAIKESSENASRIGGLEATIRHLQDTVDKLNVRIEQILGDKQ